MKKRVAIIGGGVSGVTLALLIGEKYDVTIFEREQALLIKLLKTGNGKANIYNRGITALDYNDSFFMANHAEMIEPTLDSLFKDLGVYTYTDNEGRVYPYSRSAKGLRDYLVAKLHAKVVLNTFVKEVEQLRTSYRINGESYDYVVIASGSSASIVKFPLDNGNSGLLDSLGVRVYAHVPVIKTIAIKEKLTPVANQRADVALSLYGDDKLIIRETGEVLFKDNGLSGIVSFIVSSYFEWGVRAKTAKKYKILLDLMPDTSQDEVNELLHNEKDLEKIFSPAMVTYLKSLKCNDYALLVKALPFTPVSGNNPENAQVMSGGVAVHELNSDFSLRKDPNIYLTGEVVDIDGKCGGYNLGFAFYSAWVVSNNLLSKLSI